MINKIINRFRPSVARVSFVYFKFNYSSNEQLEIIRRIK